MHKKRKRLTDAIRKLSKLDAITSAEIFSKEGGAKRMLRGIRDSAGLRTVLNIMEKWGLNDPEQAILLGVPEPTLLQWRTQVRGGQLDHPLGEDTLTRVSHLLGIWKATAILTPRENAAISFMQTANTAETFGGGSPLQRMLRGGVEDLAATRQWLDGWLYS